MGRARQNRRRRSQGGAARSLPGWAMLTIGLIIGLFVAFLVYLDELDTPGDGGRGAPATAEPGDGGASAEAEGQDDAPKANEPRFEFYSILPDLEVVVPDTPPAAEEQEAPSDAGAEASPAPAPETEGSYYLQAGSFQESKQADEMKARIALLGLDVAVQTVRVSGQRWHRVRVGPYSSRDRLRAAQERLRDHEIDYLVLREKTGD